MSPFRASLRLANKKAVTPNSIKQTVRQHLASRASGRELPTIPECPSPTCECAEMPPDLDIEMEKKLNGTMPAHSEHVLISTGQADWKSRIEDEKDTAPWGEVISNMKDLLGPKGRLHDPYRNVMFSTASFETNSDQTPGALMFPSFQYISQVQPSESSVASFLESFVLPSRDQSSQQKDSKKSITDLLKEKSQRQGLVTPISTPTILICSHNSRDSRCGILGPLLHQEFSQYINKRHTLRNKVTSDIVEDSRDESSAVSFASHPQFRPDAIDPDHKEQQPINIGMISHIGGHKWAGNVIIYIPPNYQINPLERKHRGADPKDKAAKEPIVHEDERLSKSDDKPFVSPLAGKGIWYGRVQPQHVEGIVEQTIGHGKIIKDLFRGGINQNGSTIRL